MNPTVRLDYSKTEITGGFWKKRWDLNADVTNRAVYDRFNDTGRVAAFDFNWREGMPNRPHIFWDSDIAKWIEGSAYILQKKHDPELAALCDAIIDKVELHQGRDGYFNIYFTAVEPAKRWHNRTDHELYCAGHLIEAAVAYYESTGKDKLLRCMRRYADYIEQVFVKEQSAKFFTPGHEEIELALVRLYRCTGERRYLDLSLHFVNTRGTRSEGIYERTFSTYMQDNRPARELSEAQGHAVRAMYYYCAMADLAAETGDEALLAACRRLFDSTVNRRMYVTGGIGSTHIGEAFTVDYDLPDLTAYTETCAALGLALFATRMAAVERDAKYADAAERALYNGFLSGVSLDGRSFFYENPLAADPMLLSRHTARESGEHMPIIERLEVFGCSCCPPNVTRFIASVGGLCCSQDRETVFFHQYLQGRFDFGGFSVETTTEYPFEGVVELRPAGGRRTLALRIPGWCERWSLEVCKSPAESRTEKGYVYITRDWKQGDTVRLLLEMPPFLVEAHPAVSSADGRVCLMRGPVVYCLESADNPYKLTDVRLAADTVFTVSQDALFDRVITAEGTVRDPALFGDRLYRRAENSRKPVPLRFIPYFGWANRGPNEMRVFVQYDG